MTKIWWGSSYGENKVKWRNNFLCYRWCICCLIRRIAIFFTRRLCFLAINKRKYCC
uniref:Uncharacterized protein n=1 Tax=Meloidogyne enterolobii TaxID=390850 RepID=A0A6V7UBW7_MELEN|nr:unnamed protein product [Meloidogyne enterolobii]